MFAVFGSGTDPYRYWSCYCSSCCGGDAPEKRLP